VPFTTTVAQAADPLLSWNDGKVKPAIIAFVAQVTQEGAPDSVPPEQVIGSSIRTKFELRDGKPVLMRLPELDFIDDTDGEPVAINKFIGRRPILAFGNSDGDLQMLQWTVAGIGARFMGLVHHTDFDRENGPTTAIQRSAG
jgi:hypothetical protein